MESDFQQIDFDLPKNQSHVIKVVGVGGGGSNAVNYMYRQGIKGVDFVACNTDAQALQNSPVPNKIQLGVSLTEGLGAGANPEIGERSALESIDELSRMLSVNTKMIFITAGMGGGTGTGAAPVIAKMAQDLGILTVGIVTMPFQFEGKTRNDQAETGLNKLRRHVDSLIVINNNKLREIYGDLGFKQGFAKADEVLANASRGIAEVITHHYTQNIDLRDAKTVLSDSGTAIMGSATASGTHRGQEAVSKALDSPLLNDNKIIGAKNVLLLIVSGTDEVTIDEIGIINEHIQREAGNSANIIMGIGEDESLREAISVTVIATGFNAEQQDEIVHVDPKKIIHTLEEEQAVVHTLESQQIDMFTNDTPKVAEEPKDMLIPTNEVLRNIDVAYETLVPENNPSNPSLKLEDFIIHELPPEVNDIDVVDPIEVTPQPAFEAPIAERKEEKQAAEPVLFHLEEEPVTTSTLPNEPVLKKEIHPVSSTQETEVKRYNLEDFMEATPDQVAEIEVKEPEHVKPEEELTPVNSTITEGLAKRSEERRQKLKEFNYKFYNNRLEEYEKEPAYKRAMVDLDDTDETTSVSRMSVNTDPNEEMRLRTNNSFLHVNVD